MYTFASGVASSTWLAHVATGRAAAHSDEALARVEAILGPPGTPRSAWNKVPAQRGTRSLHIYGFWAVSKTVSGLWVRRGFEFLPSVFPPAIRGKGVTVA
jgi:hypothetical protein